MSFPTSDANYEIRQFRRGEVGYNNIVRDVRQPLYTFNMDDSPLYTHVLILVHKPTNHIDATCFVREDGVYKEVYTFAKRVAAQKGIASLLLKTLIDWHRANKTGAIVWVGVAQQADGGHINLIQKVYMPLGFYFPSVFETYSVGTTISPSGQVFPFQFFSGYWSAELESIPGHIAEGQDVAMSDLNASIAYIRHNFFAHPREFGGVFKISAADHLELAGPLQQFAPIEPDVCKAPVVRPPPSERGRTYMFHTHPLVCHNIHQLYTGFPSIADYYSFVNEAFSRYTDGHIVFSAEGVFFMQLSPLLHYIVSTSPPGALNAAAPAFIDNLRNYLFSIRYEQRRILPPEVIAAIAANPANQVAILNQHVQTRIQELFYDLSKFTITIRGITFPVLYLQFQPGHIGDQKFLLHLKSLKN